MVGMMGEREKIRKRVRHLMGKHQEEYYLMTRDLLLEIGLMVE